MALDADVIVVGAGLAGLVATAELAATGRRVLLLDQEPEVALGHHELEPDLARARHPHNARPLVALARRGRADG